jgi:integrase
MAWVRERPTKDGKLRLQAAYRDPSGRIRTRTFEKGEKKKALAWAREQERSISHSEWLDPDRGKMTFATWVETWRSTRVHLRPSSRARAEIAIRRELLPRFGDHPLSSIGASEVQAMISSLVAADHAPASVRKVYNTLSAILRAAVVEGVISKSPCVGISLPQVQRHEMRALSADELQRLASEVPDRYRAMILTGGYLGLRWGELAGLKVSAVNFLKRKVHVRSTVVDVNGTMHVGPPKTGERTITLPTFLADVLAEQIARYPDAEGYVFGAPGGGPHWRRSNFSRRIFQPAVERAGLAPFRIHDLRHSAASLAIEAGAHPKQIQALLGHSSITTTIDRYGHLLPGMDEALAERMDEVGRAAALILGSDASGIG